MSTTPFAEAAHLQHQLDEALAELQGFKGKAEQTDAEIAFLISQNKALARKVSRLAMAKTEAQGENELLKHEMEVLHIEKLQVEAEAQLSRSDNRDRERRLKDMQEQLTQQSAQHQAQIAAITAKTSRLIVGVLPKLATGAAKAFAVNGSPPAALTAGEQDTSGGAGGGSSSTPAAAMLTGASADSAANGASSSSAAVLKLGFDDAAVQEQVMTILGRLCADEMGEEEALAALSGLQCSLQLQSTPTALPTPSQSSEPLPHASSKPVSTSGDSTASGLADGVSSGSVGGDGILAGSESVPQPPASPESADAAKRAESRASSRAPSQGGAGGNYGYFSQFVMADPEKLQRLIQRSRNTSLASATGSIAGDGTGSTPTATLGTTSYSANSAATEGRTGTSTPMTAPAAAGINHVLPSASDAADTNLPKAVSGSLPLPGSKTSTSSTSTLPSAATSNAGQTAPAPASGGWGSRFFTWHSTHSATPAPAAQPAARPSLPPVAPTSLDDITVTAAAAPGVSGAESGSKLARAASPNIRLVTDASSHSGTHQAAGGRSTAGPTVNIKSNGGSSSNGLAAAGSLRSGLSATAAQAASIFESAAASTAADAAFSGHGRKVGSTAEAIAASSPAVHDDAMDFTALNGGGSRSDLAQYTGRR